MLPDESLVQLLREKLYRAVKAKAVLAERSRLLAQQIDALQQREHQTDHLLDELLERQRELNYMLHRANTVLHRMHETNAALSTEFTELVKELPAPDAPDWEQRVAKINALFQQTGAIADELEDEIFRSGLRGDLSPARSDPTRSTPEREQASSSEHEPADAAAPVGAPEGAYEEDTEPAAAEVEVRAQPSEIAEGLGDEVLQTELCEEQPADESPQGEGEAELDPDLRARIERINRLFSELESDEEETGGDVEPERSPGILSRVWRRIFGRSANGTVNAHSQCSAEHGDPGRVE